LIDFLEVVDSIRDEDTGLVGKDGCEGVFEDVVVDVGVDG
jgi:hypothetical protein